MAQTIKSESRAGKFCAHWVRTDHAEGGKVEEIEGETKTRDGKKIIINEADVRTPDGKKIEIEVREDGRLMEFEYD